MYKIKSLRQNKQNDVQIQAGTLCLEESFFGRIYGNTEGFVKDASLKYGNDEERHLGSSVTSPNLKDGDNIVVIGKNDYFHAIMRPDKKLVIPGQGKDKYTTVCTRFPRKLKKKLKQEMTREIDKMTIKKGT